MDIIASHRRAALAAGAALTLALAGGMAALAGSVDVDRTVELGAEQEQPAEQAAATPEDAADALLSEEARAHRDAYGSVERGIVSTLSANVWTAARSGLTLTFDEDGRTWTENDNGEATVTAWAITAVGEQQVDTDGDVRTTTRAFTVQTPAGTAMATLTTEAYADGSASVTSLKCSLFKSSASWTLAQRAEGVEVEGPADEWYATYGTTPEALTEAFDAFIGTAWPTVSKATWDGTISVDYSAGTASLPFRLDDASQTKVTATLDLGTGGFTVGRA